jgi:hypothetical protein
MRAPDNGGLIVTGGVPRARRGLPPRLTRPWRSSRMDGAFGGNPDVPVEPPDQQFADLAGSQMGFLALEPDNQALDRLRQLIGIAYRPPGAIAQGHQALLLVAIEKIL